MKNILKLLFSLSILLFSSVNTLFAENYVKSNELPDWALGDFIRPEGKNPIIAPNPQSVFYCPVKRMERFSSKGWFTSKTNGSFIMGVLTPKWA